MMQIVISWKTERTGIASLLQCQSAKSTLRKLATGQIGEADMLKRKLWISSRLGKDTARPGLKTSIALGLTLSAAALLVPIQAHAQSIPINDPTPPFASEGYVKGVLGFPTKFLGIPYALPPVSTSPGAVCGLGNLRWCPPVAHGPLSPNPYPATAFGSNCPQTSELGVFAGPVNTTQESCLYLNVWTPLPVPGLKFPVILWIHGGGNVDGESTDYDASKMAVLGSTVVVTINYRLGSLGWLASPALDTTPPFGNYGLLDQQFAMKWVKQNIAKFGGDPNNVAVGGQSAGSEDTEAQVISTGNGYTGNPHLFNRAIFESVIAEPTLLSTAEGCTPPTSGAGCTPTATAAGGILYQKDALCTPPPTGTCVGCTTVYNAATATCLRSLPLFNASYPVGTTPPCPVATPGTQCGELQLPAHSSLIADGTILPLQNGPPTYTNYYPGSRLTSFTPGVFYTTFNNAGSTLTSQNGNYYHMPIMSGTVEDEADFGLAINAFGVGPPSFGTVESITQYNNSIANYANVAVYPIQPATGNYVKAHYPLISTPYCSPLGPAGCGTPTTNTAAPNPQLSIDPLTTDGTTCPQHRINRAIATPAGGTPSPVYAYEFDDRTAPSYFGPLDTTPPTPTECAPNTPYTLVPPACNFEALAYHTADIQYLFSNLITRIGFHGGPVPPSTATPLNVRQSLLSNALVAAWTNFASTGNPNRYGPYPWPSYDGSKSNSYYVLENLGGSGLYPVTDAAFVAAHNCDFWDTINNP
jgi:para-nitrobenzyl esterase